MWMEFVYVRLGAIGELLSTRQGGDIFWTAEWLSFFKQELVNSVALTSAVSCHTVTARVVQLSYGSSCKEHHKFLS